VQEAVLAEAVAHVPEAVDLIEHLVDEAIGKVDDVVGLEIAGVETGLPEQSWEQVYPPAGKRAMVRPQTWKALPRTIHCRPQALVGF